MLPESYLKIRGCTKTMVQSIVLQDYQKTAVNMFIIYALFWTLLAYQSSDLLCNIAQVFMNSRSLKNHYIDLISVRFKFFLQNSGN